MLHVVTFCVNLFLPFEEFMQKTQFKAPRIDALRDASIGFRTTKKIKALAEIVAYDNNMTVGMYIERLLLADFATAKVEQEEEDREPNDPNFHMPIKLSGGRLLSEAVDDLYDEDDAACFFKRLVRSRYLTHEQIRLNNLIRASRTLYSKTGTYNRVAIQQHWNILNEVAAGKTTVDSLPEGMFDGADVAYAIMSEAERIKLYRSNPEEFTRRSQAYLKATKRGSGK
jgi:hypothetical protein